MTGLEFKELRVGVHEVPFMTESGVVNVEVEKTAAGNFVCDALAREIGSALIFVREMAKVGYLINLEDAKCCSRVSDVVAPGYFAFVSFSCVPEGWYDRCDTTDGVMYRLNSRSVVLLQNQEGMCGSRSDGAVPSELLADYRQGWINCSCATGEDILEKFKDCNSEMEFDFYELCEPYPHVPHRRKHDTPRSYARNYSLDKVFRGQNCYHAHKGRSFNTALKSKFPYRVGVELEVEFSDYDELESFNAVSSNWFYRETDGSLGEYGCEIITVPLAPEDARSAEFWQGNLKSIPELRKARSWRCEETGLHVHVGVEAFGADETERLSTLGRLLYLYYYALDRSLLSRVYGREMSEYCKQFSSSEVKIVKDRPALMRSRSGQKYVTDQILEGHKGRPGDITRYFAVNATNSETVEFRQGKGSINADRISAVVDMCVLMVEYCRKHKDLCGKAYTTEGFLQFIGKRGNASLKKYISNNEEF